MTNSQHLLVPIKVQALVIDDVVIKKRAIVKLGEQRKLANDGKWSPLGPDYRNLTNLLSAPEPKPFYGATREYELGKSADQLVLVSDSPALPKLEDHGVYLHWVLPSGLRHAYKPDSLDFPALPDQWLIVRFSRRAHQPQQTKAWFVDGGLVVDSTGQANRANLLFPRGNKYEAVRAGKVVPLDQYKPGDFHGERTPITAVGNPQTGSPTFTAFVGGNRNILSWHDDLVDLRDANNGEVPDGTALTYLVVGWYHDERNEPLAVLPVQAKKKDTPKPPGWLIEPLGWFIDSASPVPADLLKRRCLFHGMIAHINYWTPGSHKGPMLGYPGSPSVAGVFDRQKPSFKVGIGNSAEDALVSLVSSEYSRAADAPNLWKALEAVIYRQPESLAGSWNAAPRDHAVHQSWFSTLEAGKVWSIRARPGKESAFSDDLGATAAQTAIKPSPEQLTELKRLNDLQSKADSASRELAALQQDLYARWWKLCAEFTQDPDFGILSDDEDAYRALAGRVADLRRKRDGFVEDLRALPAELAGKLPEELELRSDDAPRFWTPADPVIVVMNCGKPTKHQFPKQLPCRLPEQIVTTAEVEVGGDTRTFSGGTGVAQVSAAVTKHFAPHSETLTRMLEEAYIVEQAISDLVARTRATETEFFDAGSWRNWVDRLVKDLTWDGNRETYPRDQIRFGKSGATSVLPQRLADLWGQQPWSPLFLDWQITFRPTSNSGTGFGLAWKLDKYDYQPVGKEFLPAKGFTVRGRSLISPIDGRILKEPIETLRELLKSGSDGDNSDDSNPAFPPAVREILSRYKVVWDDTLGNLERSGLMGQALSGFHQALLGRDVTLPRVMPDPARPWIANDQLEFCDDEVKAPLEPVEEGTLVGERLAPPSQTARAAPFNLLRAGAFQLDELWLVDDFGQWADLLGGTSAGGSFGQVFNPRARWDDDRFAVAMPPRIVQPVRLNFRFTAADNCLVESDSDPALSSICGWIFYNPLDHSLVLCDSYGRLTGELAIIEEQGGLVVKWEAGAKGVALGEIRDPSLKAFARALVETVRSPNPKLIDLLTLIDSALERIRPVGARREAALFGRPLALVSARVGLELFGKAWTDPQKPVKEPSEERPFRTGDATLDALRVRVNLGCSHNTEDGLIGYFKAGVFDRIVPASSPKDGWKSPSGYLADGENDPVRIGFCDPETLTLLMDPWGSVQAAAGLVPAKTITLASPGLDKTLAQMEASFRVGPVLLQADRLALPTPAGDQGRWNFCGALTNACAAPLAPPDPRYFSDQPVIATEGRLLLLNSKK